MRNLFFLFLLILIGVCYSASPEGVFIVPKKASSDYVKYKVTNAEWRTAPTLRMTLIEWGKVEGWTVAYDLPDDYSITQAAVFEGTFEEAIKQLQDSIQQHKPQIAIILYKSNKVARVTTK